jgi:hypothetical protein
MPPVLRLPLSAQRLFDLAALPPLIYGKKSQKKLLKPTKFNPIQPNPVSHH